LINLDQNIWEIEYFLISIKKKSKLLIHLQKVSKTTNNDRKDEKPLLKKVFYKNVLTWK
jgi:hypothetical protein